MGREDIVLMKKSQLVPLAVHLDEDMTPALL